MTNKFDHIHTNTNKKYIIRNCPARDKFGFCWEKNLEFCSERTDCLLKRIYEDVNTVYRTPEYFNELAEKGNKEQELIESAWHNVAHMVISKLDIQEVE